MNEKSKQKTNNEKRRRKRMAILTAECDRTFIVSSSKAEDFKNKKLDRKISKKIEEAKEKFKNIKAE